MRPDSVACQCRSPFRKRIAIDWGELSWTLEDNGPVNVGIKFMGGKIYKKYRVFERSL